MIGSFVRSVGVATLRCVSARRRGASPLVVGARNHFIKLVALDEWRLDDCRFVDHQIAGVALQRFQLRLDGLNRGLRADPFGRNVRSSCGLANG